MSTASFLEDFSQPRTSLPDRPAADPPVASVDLEAKTQASYEAGFKAGWDDCTAAQESDNRRLAEALGRRLGELDLTRSQMRMALLKDIEPLFEEILQKILPLAVQKSYLPRLVEEISQAATELGPGDFVITVCEDDAQGVQDLLDMAEDLPTCTLRTDPAFGLSQAAITQGPTTREINLTSLLDTIEEAFADLFASETPAQKDVAHG